jgi:hypothetical protein
VRVNGTLVEDKMRRFKGECEHFRFNKCPIYTHDGASAKFSTNSQEMDNSEEMDVSKGLNNKISCFCMCADDFRIFKWLTVNKHGLFSVTCIKCLGTKLTYRCQRQWF